MDFCICSQIQYAFEEASDTLNKTDIDALRYTYKLVFKQISSPDKLKKLMDLVIKSHDTNVIV